MAWLPGRARAEGVGLRAEENTKTMPTLVDVKQAVEVPAAEMIGRVTGIGTRSSTVPDDKRPGQTKTVTYAELRITEVRAADGSWEAPDAEFEMKVGYPMPFSQLGAGGRVVERFTGRKVDPGSLDLDPIFLGKVVSFTTHRAEGDRFAEIDRESVRPASWL